MGEQLDRGRIFLERRKFSLFFAYFQQETTTAAPSEELARDFRMVLGDPSCIGIIISTRPDFLEDGLLDELNLLAGEEFQSKEIILELGLQSAHDRSLDLLNRNHTCADFFGAVERIRARRNLQIGAHIILGIPGEEYSDMLRTVCLVRDAGVKHLKIHHLQVIQGTELERMYRLDHFPTFDLKEYLDLLGRLLVNVPDNVVIHRLWSMSEAGIIVAPLWDVGHFEMGRLLRQVLFETGRRQGLDFEVLR